jgi:hypothetical protein
MVQLSVSLGVKVTVHTTRCVKHLLLCDLMLRLEPRSRLVRLPARARFVSTAASISVVAIGILPTILDCETSRHFDGSIIIIIVPGSPLTIVSTPWSILFGWPCLVPLAHLFARSIKSHTILGLALPRSSKKSVWRNPLLNGSIARSSEMF